MKTTQKDFDLFKKECLRLKEKWHLDDWSVVFEHYNHKDGSAQCVRDIDGRRATLGLSKLGNNVFENKILEWAKHEMIHLVLADLGMLANRRYATEKELDREEERLVEKLMTIIS